MSFAPSRHLLPPGSKDDLVVGALIFPEFQLLDLAGPIEVFAATPGIQTILISSTGDAANPIGMPRVAFGADASFSNAPTLDVLFVPGGAGVRHAIDDLNTIRFLRERADEAQFITSVCTGAFVLGAAGLLQGYRCATHWRYMDLLPMVGAAPVDERVVRDRNRITGGGVTAGIDFGLFLVQELIGTVAAEKAQLYLQYDPQPPLSAGHPKIAPSNVVDSVRKDSQESYQDREALLERVMARVWR